MYYGAEIANTNYQTKRFANLTTTAQQAIGGTAALAGRKYLLIWNQAGANVYWSFDSTLSSSNVLSKASGALEDGDQTVLPYGPNLQVYICTQTGQANVLVTEIS